MITEGMLVMLGLVVCVIAGVYILYHEIRGGTALGIYAGSGLATCSALALFVQSTIGL